MPALQREETFLLPKKCFEQLARRDEIELNTFISFARLMKKDEFFTVLTASAAVIKNRGSPTNNEPPYQKSVNFIKKCSLYNSYKVFVGMFCTKCVLKSHLALSFKSV